MKLIALFAALLAATVALGQAPAQQPPTIGVQANTVYIGADGRFEAPPDTALLQFNISTQADSSKEAYDRASKAAQQIRELLRSNGVDPKQAEIGFFSLNPVYDYRNPKRKLVAYRVNSSVSLKLKDFTKIAPIAQQLSDIDVTQNQTISYTLENIDVAKVRAVEDAFQRAHSEAAALARAGGRQLGELSYASADTFEPVRVLTPRVFNAQVMTMAAERAPSAPPPTAEFTPQNIVVTAHVNVMFTLR